MQYRDYVALRKSVEAIRVALEHAMEEPTDAEDYVLAAIEWIDGVDTFLSNCAHRELGIAEDNIGTD